jgi:hypothetical protein
MSQSHEEMALLASSNRSKVHEARVRSGQKSSRAMAPAPTGQKGPLNWRKILEPGHSPQSSRPHRAEQPKNGGHVLRGRPGGRDHSRRTCGELSSDGQNLRPADPVTGVQATAPGPAFRFRNLHQPAVRPSHAPSDAQAQGVKYCQRGGTSYSYRRPAPHSTSRSLPLTKVALSHSGNPGQQAPVDKS